MWRVGVVMVAGLVLTACRERPTQPRIPPGTPSFATDPADNGPPAPRNFGRDNYRTGVFTGAGTTPPGLTCDKDATKARVCNGFLASDVDGTLLDVTLQVPAGGGPFPLALGGGPFGRLVTHRDGPVLVQPELVPNQAKTKLNAAAAATLPGAAFPA